MCPLFYPVLGHTAFLRLSGAGFQQTPGAGQSKAETEDIENWN